MFTGLTATLLKGRTSIVAHGGILSTRMYAIRYSGTHEWIDYNDAKTEGYVGLTEYASVALGDITHIELPAEGTELNTSDPAGSVESVKAASDIFSPVCGTVLEINPAALDTPDAVIKGKKGNNWLFKMSIHKPSELDDLMDEGNFDELQRKKDEDALQNQP